LCDGSIEIVNVVLVMADLAVVEIAQGIADGACGVCCRVAFCRIEKPDRSGECFLDGQLNFSMGQTGDVGELPSDLGREGKEVGILFFHDTEELSDALSASKYRAISGLG
jgi:hypothetical protein